MPLSLRMAALLLLLTGSAAAQPQIRALRNDPAPRVLVLGMFHFQDAGLDGYKPQFAFDVRTPARQRELNEVLDRLAAWRPTRIAIESRPARQARLDSLFAVYPGNGMDTLRNEIYQIGFRLARRLALPGVVAIDAEARELDPDMTREEYDRTSGSLRRGPLAATDWNARFTALYRTDDSLKSVRPLRATLLYINSPERLRAGHGHYLVGDLLNGEPGEYFGADGFASTWYNRNLRIYSNIVRRVRGPDERILVLIGAGHVPILRELLLASPVLRLDEVSDVLR